MPWISMKRLDGAKLEVPIKWGFYVYVAIFFALSVANPLYNWDMIGYVGAAKSMLRGDHASNHEYTYSLLQKTVPDRVFEELTTGERKAVTYDDPESFTQHLGFYRQRLMYVCLLAFVMFFNINPFVASHVISALCATMALWILGHMSQRPTSLGYLVAMAASLVSGLYITARYSTPDAMAALVFVALCWATVKHMKVALVLLPLSILVRFELVVLALPFGVYLYFFRDADRRAILASLAACIAVGVFVRTGVSGHSWLTVVGYTFKEHSAFPSTAHFEMSLAEYMQFLGSGLPKYHYGLNARAEWNGFDLSVSTFGAAGFKAVDFVDVTLRSSYFILNKSVDLLNAWRPDNTDTDVPRIAYKSTGSITNDMFSQRFIQDASYLKIANIELGYNFPNKWFGGYVHGVRLYASAQNLFTLSKYRGYNVDFAGGTFTPGYNYASYPSPRTVMFGAHFSF